MLANNGRIMEQQATLGRSDCVSVLCGYISL